MSSSLDSVPVSWPGHQGCQRRAEVPGPAGLFASPEQTRLGPEGGILCVLLVITDVAEFWKVCTIHWWKVLFPWESRVSQEMTKNCQRKEFLERVGWSLTSRRQGALPHAPSVTGGLHPVRLLLLHRGETHLKALTPIFLLLCCPSSRASSGSDIEDVVQSLKRQGLVLEVDDAGNRNGSDDPSYNGAVIVSGGHKVPLLPCTF